MTAAIVYAAKSSPDEKASTADQVEQIVARLDADPDRQLAGEPFTEENVSAYHGSRGPELEAAMALAIECAETDGQAELWVFHSSRLARGSGLKAGARSLMEVFTYLRRHGVAIRSLEDDAYVTDEAFIGMASKMANKFSEDLSTHTRRGKRQAAAKGRPSGGIPPYGYRYEGRREECRLVEDPAEAAIVRRVFEAVAGGRSQLQVAKDLNGWDSDLELYVPELTVPTKRGGRWAQGTLTKLLRNPVYIGKVAHRGELHEGAHEAIVTPQLWDRVQRVLSAGYAKSGARGRRPKQGHLFLKAAVQLRCGECGSAMVPRTVKRKDGSEHGTYYCLGRNQSGPGFCSRREVRRELVDLTALAYFKRAALDVDATRAEFEAGVDRELAAARALADRADRDRLQKLDAVRRLEADYESGEISGRTFERLAARLEDEIAALTAQAERLRSQEAGVLAAAAGVDAEAAVLAQLAHMRTAIVGAVRDAEGLDAVRAALAALFDHFTLIDSDAPHAYLQAVDEAAHRAIADGDLERAWAFVDDPSPAAAAALAGPAQDATRLPVAGTGLALVPRVRADVVAGYDDALGALPRRTPLSKRENIYVTASATAYLFAPIPLEPINDDDPAGLAGSSTVATPIRTKGVTAAE